ncbi:hypothetical protein [Pajaroellobacter abortibovis]|uniref:Metallo-beta-lactamase domain-containing protein n=1 Tax=Pajaroellobacter abortibovis TaxID=1882918 RepID=A0A1L6MUW8_9BACT|nr:hypothetical protein [Pajaroellobacter abortibovis]APR99310.1 hypothetical protein BCY86_00435 [Pajaroellobacter abortibovis]
MVGDTEQEQEQKLLSNFPHCPHATMLKVGHHSSRTSSYPAFLAEVQAKKEAILPVIIHNRSSHPHDIILQSLTASGARLWRTDQQGSIFFLTDSVTYHPSAMAFTSLQFP